MSLPCVVEDVVDAVKTRRHDPVGAPALIDPKDDLKCAVARPMAPKLMYPLTDQQLAEYREKGFLHLKGVFSSEETREWLRACDALEHRTDLLHPDNRRFELSDPDAEGRRRLWKADPFIDLSVVLGAIARDRRILDPLASIYGGREPRLFKDKLICKPPGGRGSGLHQDYNWWQGFPTSLISVMVALDPADRANGCTELFPGDWRGLLTERGEFGNLKEDQIDAAAAESILTEPGDVALFHSFTPPRAGKNESNRWRRQIFLTYNDSADGEHYQTHRDHYLWYITRYRSPEDQARGFFK